MRRFVLPLSLLAGLLLPAVPVHAADLGADLAPYPTAPIIAVASPPSAPPPAGAMATSAGAGTRATRARRTTGITIAMAIAGGPTGRAGSAGTNGTGEIAGNAASSRLHHATFAIARVTAAMKCARVSGSVSPRAS
jgi:hypothetical protein